MEMRVDISVCVEVEGCNEEENFPKKSILQKRNTFNIIGRFIGS